MIKLGSWKNMNNKKEQYSDAMSLVQYTSAAAQVQQHSCKEYERKNDSKIELQTSLLALEVVIYQAGKPYSNLGLNNIKYNNNKQPTVQKQYVNACMSPNILSDE